MKWLNIIVPLAFLALGAIMFAAMALTMIAMDVDDDVLMGIMVSGILMAIASGVVLGANVVRRQGRMRHLMALSAVLAPIALLAWLTSLWSSIATPRSDDPRLATPPSDDPRLILFALALTVVSVGLAYTGLMTLQPTRSILLRAVRGMVIGGAWLCGCCLTGLATILWLAPEYFVGAWGLLTLVYHFLSLLALVVFTGSLIVPLMVRNHARRQARPRESVSSTMRMALQCPRCAIDLEVKQGPARCDACGFTMMIEVEEPRCECGYLLFALTTTTCPECGRNIERKQPQNQEPRMNADERG